MGNFDRTINLASPKPDSLKPSIREFVNSLKNFSLQAMTLADLPAIMAIEQYAYATPWPEASYRHELEHGMRSFFDLLTYRRQAIGYSGIWYFVEEVHLGTLVVHPALQRQGLGELLLLNVIQRAIALNTKTVTLEVRPTNVAAQQLYLKYGFEEAGYRKNYYRDREDAIIMTTIPLTSPPFQTLLASLIDRVTSRIIGLNPDAVDLILTN